MTRKETKEAAQDVIMQRLADTLLFASEDGTTQEVIDEVRKLAISTGRRYGYVSWPGIW